MADARSSLFNLRCAECGHVGSRVFERRDGVLQDVLEPGLTPDYMECDCGAPSDMLMPVPVGEDCTCHPADGCGDRCPIVFASGDPGPLVWEGDQA